MTIRRYNLIVLTDIKPIQTNKFEICMHLERINISVKITCKGMFCLIGLKHSRSHATLDDIQVGDKVLVAGKRTGVVRFIGSTDFAPGWCGLVLFQSNLI